jgi:8-oxo-dGTP pyrophosphatase MutT (NUDIX family)
MDVVCAIITNNKGEILLQKKTLDYKRSPGRWSLFGGQAESEDMKKEMERELMEELGVEMNPKMEFDFDFKSSDNSGKFYIYSSRWNDLSKFSIGEGAGIAFFGRSELPKLDIDTFSDKAIKLFLKSHFA